LIETQNCGGKGKPFPSQHMLQTLKFTGDEKTFFASADLHINQTCSSWENPLWKMRGFDCKEDHARGVKESWNATCDENSTCFHLGDIVFEDEHGENFVDILHSLRFKTLYLLLGNHNSGQGIVYKRILAEKFPEVFTIGAEVYPLEWEITEKKKVVFLPQYAEVTINRNFVVLSHYPMTSHNKMSKKSIHLSGHCHQNLPLTNKDTGRGKRLDVGWDGWGRPVSFFEIKNHLRGRDIDNLDHHGEGINA
jgi:calcineurin-like phosphoesterase family protein